MVSINFCGHHFHVQFRVNKFNIEQIVVHCELHFCIVQSCIYFAKNQNEIENFKKGARKLFIFKTISYFNFHGICLLIILYAKDPKKEGNSFCYCVHCTYIIHSDIKSMHLLNKIILISM